MLQDRYRIVSPLRQGGMGAVYRAWDTRLNVPVALKEMTYQPGLDRQTLSQLLQQFQQEAQILARLNHPHLVRVGDFFEEESNAYLAMDFIEGESLADRIKREGAQPEAQVLDWGGQLLQALAYCHNQGIIHRDIKPQNVIIRPDGQAVLVDFGLVKLWDPHDPRTRTAMRGMGTPEYAPPEQYDTQAGHTDARSDVYGLGATLYHTLTGQAPPTATLRMADPGQFVSPRKAMPGLSPTTEMAVLKALELPRSQRWQSAAEMAAALGISGIPALVQPPSHATPTVSGRGRTKAMPGVLPVTTARRRVPGWAWALGGLVVLALVIGAGVIMTMMVAGKGISIPLLPARETATTAPPVVKETATTTPSPSPPPTATATPSPSPSPTATARPQSTSTSVHTPAATATATPQPSQTAKPTSIRPTPTRGPESTPTPAVQGTSLELVAPAQGGEYKSPVTCQWRGSLSAGQAYQVTLYHPASGHTIQSEPLTNQSWTTDLPGETGEWRWRVSVVKNGTTVTTSPEGMFWYNPFPGGGEPGEQGPTENTPAPP
jgi:serine/threonine protein kinase